jgi:hypothetical protein
MSPPLHPSPPCLSTFRQETLGMRAAFPNTLFSLIVIFLV